jgi:hypothetical protein
MRRIVLLSSLTQGRCFTFEVPTTPFDEERPGEKLAAAKSILTPEAAWKIVGVTAGEFDAVNASGETKRFEGNLKVTELPREGWDRLAARVRGAD